MRIIYTHSQNTYVAHETQTPNRSSDNLHPSGLVRRGGRGPCRVGVLFLLGNRKPGGTFIHSAVYTFRSLCGCRIPLPSLFSGLNKRNVPCFGCVVMQGRVSDSLLLFGVHERRLLRTIKRALFSLPAAFIRPARRTRCETPTAGFAQK